MKIALLGAAHPYRGGIVHFNSHLAKSLLGRPDLDVDLYYWSRLYPTFLLPGGDSTFLDQQSTLTFYLPGLHILNYTNPLTRFELLRRVRRARYDVLVTHWVHPVHFPVFKVLFKGIQLLTQTRICLIVHNCLPHEHMPGAAAMSRAVFRDAHRLIVHSASEAQRAEDLGLSNGKMVTAFHPTYDQFVLPAESPESIRSNLGLRRKVLLFFGFIRPYKGTEILFEAFQIAASRHPDLSLLVVGEEFSPAVHAHRDDTSPFSRIAPDNPVRSQIVLIDHYVTNEEVGRYFAVADALVAPYLSATQSGPIQIAYAFDKPVLASDLPAFRQCVSHGESGYLFAAGSAEDLAEKIGLLIREPIGTEKIRHYRRKFSWEHYVSLMFGSEGTGRE